MADKDNTVVDGPVEEPKVEEPKTEDKPDADTEPVEEPKVEEPKTEESDSSAAAPAGTDQHGRQLYSVKCANCGKQTEVPFQPTGDRPVYCRDCYVQKR